MQHLSSPHSHSRNGHEDAQRHQGGARGGHRPGDKRRWPKLNLPTGIFMVYVAVCFGAIFYHCGVDRAGTSLIWALACMTVGAAFGFLFGIPKILQNDRPMDDAASSAVVGYRQQVNTNLTEISDWLTKIIVGLGLINLSNIPGHLNGIAQTLAVSVDKVDPELHKAFAYAVIVCFSILGFLTGYLYTRLSLQSAFSRADQEAAARQQAASLETTVSHLSTQVETLTQHPGGDAPAVGAPAGGTPGPRRGDPLRDGDAMAGLRRMADAYLRFHVEDVHERLRRKNDMCKEMYNYVMSHHISKADLVAELERQGNDGITLALAHCILMRPEKGDLDYLLPAARRVSRWHVQYRVVQAIGKLFGSHCASSYDRRGALELLDAYEATAGPSLHHLIFGTRSIIEGSASAEDAVAV